MRVGERNVLVLRRFDRDKDQHRISYISAMTAVGADDGQRRDYADLAVAIRDLSDSPKTDHLQLFDRVVANVALGNTDDHLRNHGFLARGGAWALSPAFDVNPSPDPWRTRKTSIMGADSLGDEAQALLALAHPCGLTVPQGRERIARIVRVFGDWRQAARKNQVREHEITLMAQSLDARVGALQAL